ncbi:MAG: LysR family transcriptional regulator [Comamonadaceae bacterium]|nr:MAG: LysR family transcriptional regulator [Comamonadaceae bacterium]
MQTAINATVLSALPCFEAAARHLSFTRAGLELHLTTGAVSQQIRQLEERLGCLLFNRLGRGLSLTPDGEALLGAVDASFALLGGVVAKLGGSAGPLVVSCSPSFAMLWLMPRLRNFHTDHPEIEIKLVAEFQTVDRASLSAGRIDAAIRYDTTDYKGVQMTRLMGEHLLPIASPQYVADHREALGKPGFDGATLLHDATPWDGAAAGIEWRTWLDEAAPQAISSPIGQEFNLFVMALSAARNHQGVCMGRSALVDDEIRSGALVNFSEIAVLSPATYKLITSRAEDPRVAALTAWLEKECATFEDSGAACGPRVAQRGPAS